MRVKCDYCDTVFEDTLDRCPSCGAANPKRNVGDNKPRTIEELKQWYMARKLPPAEVTRFFIGQDYQQPKAFGIYKNEHGEFVVYKNKADGSRAVRYQGKDEEFAVNELYQKLKDEIVHQSKRTNARVSTNANISPRLIQYIIVGSSIFIVLAVLFIIFATVFASWDNTSGYYIYSNRPYYKDGANWYVYDYDSEDWATTSEPLDYDYNDNSEYQGVDYNTAIEDWNIDSSEFSNVEDSSVWEDSHYYDSDYDSDYDWDSGSGWDSDFSSDWDSDW